MGRNKWNLITLYSIKEREICHLQRVGKEEKESNSFSLSLSLSNSLFLFSFFHSLAGTTAIVRKHVCLQKTT
ncbi:hypothetical protein TanjilG_28275 [Lupinus angustifolius]|uniref:Uncharacterized protein n=1 Tax=Lupinus angustifolius TaxID=3871 RepID=A0A394DG86_LUPAN|nr:hypothetical protein TanjilG_02966 [Lupinus angustifolius]OIW21995.1 hypothetical protein TanjilG_28275 [Lupinus angustifolius]